MKKNRLIAFSAIFLFFSIQYSNAQQINSSELKKENSEWPQVEQMAAPVDPPDDGGGGGGSNYPPDVPTTSFTFAYNCSGNTTVTRTSSPPPFSSSFTVWYWQTSSGGTSKSSPGSSYNVTSSRTMYLRAHNENSGLWSSAKSVYVSVYSTPSAPSVSISNQCGQAVLTRTSSQSGVTYYWQSSASGTSTSNSSSSITRTSGSTYYLRSRNNTAGCWGSTKTVNYAIKSIPSKPTATVSNQCGQSVLTNTSSQSGVTYYWQSSATGTSTGSPNSIIRTTGSTYYLRGRMSNGCWSSALTVSYSIKSMPAEPSGITMINECGQTRLRRGTPPGGVTWYWQSSASGTSTSVPGDEVIRTTGTTYYIRARNNSSLCWSDATSVSYVVHGVPSIPPSPDITEHCGYTELTYGAPPSNHTYYWQTASGEESISNSAPTISFTSSGTYYLRSRNNSTGCWSAARTVTYNIKPVPDVPLLPTNEVSRCNTGAVTLSAAPAPGANTVRWYEAETGGTAVYEGLEYEVPSLDEDKAHYVTSYHTTNLCESETRVPIQVTVHQTALPIVTDESRCGDGSITLSATPGAGGDGVRWYAAETGGTTLHEGTDYTITNLTATTTYYAATYNQTNTCEDDERAAVIAQYMGQPLQFDLISGGVFCSLTAGGRIKMEQTEGASVTYTLLKDGVSTGVSQPGTSGELVFSGIVEAGNYTIEADKTGCVLPMNGAINMVYASSCTEVLVTDTNFEQTLIDKEYDGALDGLIYAEEVAGVEVLDVSSLTISDLTGIEAFTALTGLTASNNTLTSLDVSTNLLLTSLSVENNQLTALDVSTNTALTTLDVSSNPALGCVQVNSDQQTNYSSTWTKDAQTSFLLNCGTTSIPDTNFEQALIAAGYDYTADGTVYTENIMSLTSLNIGNQSISDLTGISGFTALEVLDCSQNPLTTYDFSTNTNLRELIINNTGITTLDLTNHTQLEILDVSSNQLGALDLSTNTVIRELNTSSNNLVTLSLANNTSLESLDVSANQLTGLDLSSQAALITLDFSSNQIDFIDLKQNEVLTTMNSTGNTGLTCIQVSQSHFTQIPANWQSDPVSKYDEYCGLTHVPDDNFEQALIDLSLDDVLDDFVATTNIESLTSLDVSGKAIADLSGIEEFIGLENLHVSDNALAYVDLSKQTALTVLTANDNQLMALDLANQVALVELNIDHNQLESVDLSANTALEKLMVSFNRLLNLDIQANTELEELTCSSNLLTTLDLSGHTSLWAIDASINQISDLNLISTGQITHLNMADNKLADLDVTEQINLKELDCSVNNLVTLVVTPNTLLENLNCSTNGLTSLDLSNNPNLTTVDTRYNPEQICIQVNQQQQDNIPAGWQKDEQTTYSVFCQLLDAVSTSQELWDQAYEERGSAIADDVTLRWNAETGKLEVLEGAGSYFARDDQGNLIYSAGKLALGVNAIPHDDGYNYSLAVGGDIITSRLKVRNVGAWNWPDYVFEKEYNLRPLQELETYIKANKHLPEIPSAEEVEENGLDVSDMNNLLLKKIEELTLYIIELKKEVDELKQSKYQ